ncbi:hypothetical protein Molly5_49 [Maribacter phage Molly_5]|uniref:Uncharacterized protein n=1 Tax=Maribacter phage Molly_1 TaxID=2745685 RepID=A0A8E4XVF5_9CAUD|nr:hypothetical protein M1M29_gp049 [Maribacter phage Molly_1]QQO97732.1 hypothetical protein Molly2_49 [Maribacter phage Molly_2]QQO97932.1 hypothetical protein Molly3_49 [Maribacter phage Molly_3]QQO98132.1 hypothetical protein Molly4_49 [Maribacter phage Molly_4]QQO98332.1 hypothetical protein Molly5_49 [Maribacter phage Molly_5]QQO97532.1 hypothetical protein Molly1_49 [Maribacter phage Molly_1]
MVKSTKYLVIGIVVLLVLLAVLASRYFNTVKQLKNSETNLELTEQKIIKEKDKFGNEIATIQSMVVRKNSEILKLKDSIKGIKSNTIVRVVTKTVRDTIEVEAESPPDIVDNRLLLPFSFGYSGDWLKFKGSINTDGITRLVDYEDTHKLNLYVGSTTNKWYQIFRKKKSIVKLTDENPFSTVTEFESITIEEDRPKRFGIGVHLGYGGQSLDALGPTISAGLNYNLIRF